MPSATPTGIPAHDNACIKAAGAHQAAMAAGGNISASAAKAADLAFHRTCLASAKANSVQPGVFMQALFELGTGGT